MTWSGVRSAVADAARAVWPRSRRWRRFLAELPLDPDELGRPVEGPGERDLIICGCPRTGTTLVAAALYQPPAVVTAMEPWDGMRLPPAELFASLRREIEETGRLRRQRLDVDALLRDGAVRWCLEGSSAPEISVRPGFVLGVKWPAYWRYLELLADTRFVVTIRHPVEVIASFARAGGRLALGLNYDTRFNRKMNEHLLAATRDTVVRRVLLFDYIHSRILPHLGRPNVFVVRYERWFSEREELMRDLGSFLGVELRPGPPRITPPSAPEPRPEDLALIREHCRTAAALGYALETV